VLSSHEDFSFHHCVDSSFKKNKTIKKNGNSIVYSTNTDAVFSDSTIDAVIVATPFATHYPLVKGALLSKKHVLVEKPMVKYEKEAKEIISLALKEKKTLMVDHTFLYDDAILLIKKYIHSPKFGELEAFYATHEQYGPFYKGESVVWDLGVHDVSLARFFFEREPVSVESQHEYSHIDEKSILSQFHLKFSKHQHAFVRVSWVSPEKRRELTLIGTKAIITYNPVKSDMLFWYERKNSVLSQQKIFFDRKETLISVLSHFAKSIRSHTSPLTDGEEGLKTIQILQKLDSLE
jgi:predicted dehydrogenase